MKFPLKERPFDHVALPQDRLTEIERVAECVVEANLNEFHDFVHKQNRVMSKSQYKAIKKHENVTVYKELTSQSERTLGPRLGNEPRRRTNAAPLLPKLVAVGTVRGRMDDMLLGTAVRDAASVVVKTSFVNDEIVDCSVLHEMQGASPADPFRFLALKWIVKSPPSGFNAVIAPRDLIVVQSSGLLAGEGIGYHLLHSVDAYVPECPKLPERMGLLRSRVSAMFIFRQLAPDVIEIYTTTCIEPNGSAPEAVGVAKTVKSMALSWKSLAYSHNVKLSWVLLNKSAYVAQSTHRRETINTGDACELCHKKATLAGRLDDCAICDSRVCARCRVQKKLTKANRRLELKVEKHEFCKTCLVRVVNEDAVRIAAEMNVGVPITSWTNAADPTSRTFSFAGSHSDTSSSRGGSSSGTGRRHPMPPQPQRRNTSATERDLESLAYSEIMDTSRSKGYRDAPSEAYTTLLTDDGNEFHDSTDDDFDIRSVDLLSVDDDDDYLQRSQSPTKLAQMTRQQQHAKRKQELYLQYQRQLQAMEREESQYEMSVSRSPAHQQIVPVGPQQVTPYRSASADVGPSTRTPPPPPPVRSTSEGHKSQQPLGGEGDPSQEHFHKLYAQMKSLQLAAEKTFELTRDNERKLSHDTHHRQREWAR
jgi:hypothetical protein